MGKKPEKFLFNLHNFDNGTISIEKAPPIEESEVEQPIESEPPPPPTFSEEELSAEKQKAFKAGEQKGRADSDAAHNQAMQNILQSIAEQIPVLMAQQQTYIRSSEIEALRLTETIFQKLFPHFIQEHGLGELKNAILNILNNNQDIQKINITIHPDHKNDIRSALEDINQIQNTTITTSEAIPLGSCKIKWESGGAHHSPDAVAEEITKILNAPLQENAKKEKEKQIEDSPATPEYDTMTSEACETNKEGSAPPAEKTPENDPNNNSAQASADNGDNHT